jgi:acyl-homoserine lactone acylase PvdQ
VEAAEALSDAPVYLAPDGGFTTVAARQAVPGDPEYLPPFAKDLARAREAARQKRQSPQRERVSMMQAQAGELQREMTDMKLRNRARRIAHDLAHLDLALRVLDSEASLARDEPDVDSDSPPSQGPSDVVSPAQLGE